MVAVVVFELVAGVAVIIPGPDADTVEGLAVGVAGGVLGVHVVDQHLGHSDPGQWSLPCRSRRHRHGPRQATGSRSTTRRKRREEPRRGGEHLQSSSVEAFSYFTQLISRLCRPPPMNSSQMLSIKLSQDTNKQNKNCI